MNPPRHLKTALVATLLSVATLAHAEGVERFKSLLSALNSGQARFEQTVTDKNQKVVQQASGTFSFAKPGKFRWAAEKPGGQLIVADGAKVWIYDEDLKQVTVKAQDKAFGSTPAALLAGRDELEKGFTLRDLGVQGALTWIEAQPKNKEAGFDSVRIALDKDVIAQMEFFDSFGNRTVIKLVNFQKNPKLAPADFTFTAPKGVDVVQG